MSLDISSESEIRSRWMILIQISGIVIAGKMRIKISDLAIRGDEGRSRGRKISIGLSTTKKIDE